MRHFQLQSGSMSPHKAACRPKAVITLGTANPGRQLIVQQARRQAPIVEEEVQQASEQQIQEATGFSAVVQKLLHRAASSLTRGQTTCLACKGQGTCTCPACNGTGIVDKDVRQNVMRHTAQKVRSMLQVERSEYHSDWLTSNRCRRCHGAGVCVCPTCQGLGTRHASGGKLPQ